MHVLQAGLPARASCMFWPHSGTDLSRLHSVKYACCAEYNSAWCVLLACLQVLSIGLGVGLAAVLGMLKFMYNLPLKALIAGSLVPTLAAACWMQW